MQPWKKKKSPRSLLKLLALGETTHLAHHVVFPLGESDYEARYRPAIESRHTSFGSNGNKLRFFFLEAIRLLGDDTAGLGFGKQIVIEVGAQDWERSVPVFLNESDFFFMQTDPRTEGKGGKGLVLTHMFKTPPVSTPETSPAAYTRAPALSTRRVLEFVFTYPLLFLRSAGNHSVLGCTPYAGM